MRKPRIIFFDIDGTLIDMEKKQVTPLMLDTLHRLQANGIRLHRKAGRHRARHHRAHSHLLRMRRPGLPGAASHQVR